MQNLYKEFNELLSVDDRLVSEGKLMKNKVVELALNLDPLLLKHLLRSESLKKHFFGEVEGVLIFDKIKFQKFVSNKKFLPDSFTAFKNKIGFSLNDELLSESNEVVLAWPYKDCVLEGGQEKDDTTRKEVFWNETLAPDQIDRLLSPKVFTNLKKIGKDGESYPDDLSVDTNLLIKGNNLLALHSLKPFRGMVKLICIDPPYNKGGNDFNYNDSFNHSTWLTFMKNRLEVAKTLLHKNGTIFIFCDDDEHAYLKVLCDEVMGRESFIATVVWKHSDNSNNDAKKFSSDHNYILVYSHNEKWESIKLERGEENASHFSNPDEDPRGPWFDGNPVNSPNPRKNLMYDITAKTGTSLSILLMVGDGTLKPLPKRWQRVRFSSMKNSQVSRESHTCGNRRHFLRLPCGVLRKRTHGLTWMKPVIPDKRKVSKRKSLRVFPQVSCSKHPSLNESSRKSLIFQPMRVIW
jgi:adenine-specific DNA-methyltransferase